MDEELRRLEIELRAGFGNRQEFFSKMSRYSPKKARDVYFKFFSGISTQITVSELDLANILVSAFEGGGMSSWAKVVEYVYPPGFSEEDFFRGGIFNIPPKRGREFSGREFSGGPAHMMLPLLPGGAVMVQDMVALRENLYRIDREALARGLKILADNHLKILTALINHEGDTFTADALVQCAVLGDIVYG